MTEFLVGDFEVGDRVITTTTEKLYSNRKGTVTGFDGYGVLVNLDESPEPAEGPLRYQRNEIELLIEPRGMEDATDPDYYRFGNVEVRQISGHLTGFGAQALQYIARATRLDGQNKGDAVEDLRKAVRFIEWEIERLEGK